MAKKGWEKQYNSDVLRSVENNHLWINAFACITPTDEIKRQIGEYVLSQLASKENTILSKCGHMMGLDHMREAVIRFNKS